MDVVQALVDHPIDDNNHSFFYAPEYGQFDGVALLQALDDRVRRHGGLTRPLRTVVTTTFAVSVGRVAKVRGREFSKKSSS